MPAGSEVEDEWEYEYSVSETEILLVDLDLSTVNGIIQSKNAGDRKSLRRPGQTASNAISIGNENRTGTDVIAGSQDQDEGEDVDIEEEVAANGNENVNKPSSNTIEQRHSPGDSSPTNESPADRFQLLDLDTTNPIVSYNGHIYSCTWHDMIGTSMFITKHQEAPFHEPEIATEDYDLVGTSRIKLVGQQAKMVSKTVPQKRARDNNEDTIEESRSTRGFQRYLPDGRSLGTITRTNPKTNIEIKQQAGFLERLMEIKKSRGETDTVRTFVDRHTTAVDARLARKAVEEKGKARAGTNQHRLRREISELNRRVIKGDNDALERLQEIYADMEEADNEDENDDNDDEDEDLITNTIRAIPSPGSAQPSSDAASHYEVPAAGAGRQAPHIADSIPNGASGSATLD